MPHDTTEQTQTFESNPFRILQLTQHIVPLDRGSDRAIILARAFCVARDPADVFVALRMARLWTVDATGALAAACFAPYIGLRDHGMSGEEFETLRELAFDFRDAMEE